MNPIQKNFSKDTVLSVGVLVTGIAWFVLAAASAPLASPVTFGASNGGLAFTHAPAPVRLSVNPAPAPAPTRAG